MISTGTPDYRPMLDPSKLLRCSVLLALAAAPPTQLLSGVPIGGLDSGASVSAEQSADRMDRALEGIRHGKAEAAFSELHKVVKPQPTDHYLLGWMYRYGEGVDVDPAAARREFRAAAKGRVPQAFLHLAEMDRAEGHAQGLEAALTQAALLGDAGAMWQLARLLREGRGVAKRPSRAHAWAVLAAEGGDPRAKSHLHRFVRDVRSTGPTERDQVDMLREAVRSHSEDGVVSLQLGLRSLVHRRADRGAKEYQRKNYKMALWLLRPLAAGEHPVALFYVARMFEMGRGVAKDPARAVELYLRATRLGISTAADNLGLMALQGRGTAKDPVAAAKLFHLAAVAGDVDGMLNHGYCLGTGTGVGRDLVQGAAWYHLAAARGNETAAKNLAAVSTELSAGQRAEAKALSERLDGLVRSGGFDLATLPSIPEVEPLRRD